MLQKGSRAVFDEIRAYGVTLATHKLSGPTAQCILPGEKLLGRHRVGTEA